MLACFASEMIDQVVINDPTEATVGAYSLHRPVSDDEKDEIFMLVGGWRMHNPAWLPDVITNADLSFAGITKTALNDEGLNRGKMLVRVRRHAGRYLQNERCSAAGIIEVKRLEKCSGQRKGNPLYAGNVSHLAVYWLGLRL